MQPGRVAVQIEKASEKPSFCPPSQRAESTVIQTEGAVMSLRRRLVRSNWASRMRCIISMPKIATVAFLKRLTLRTIVASHGTSCGAFESEGRVQPSFRPAPEG